jgi:hypothetical protein
MKMLLYKTVEQEKFLAAREPSFHQQVKGCPTGSIIKVRCKMSYNEHHYLN